MRTPSPALPATPFRTAIVGLGNPGLQHARCASSLPEDFKIVAGCDVASDARTSFAAELGGVATHESIDELLEAVRPEVVILATNETPRCALALQAVAAGVRGLYVEKPMAVGLGDARRMTEACEAAGVALIVNHQRRTLPVFRTLRRLLDEGAIGDVRVIRASCAGDLMVDGTHLINTVGYLFHDAEAVSVSGMLQLKPNGPLKPHEDFTGRRCGHAVEYGAFGLVEYAGGRRAEYLVGCMQLPGTSYQTYEVVGTKGTLRRDGDGAEPALLLQHESVAGWRAVALDVPPGYVAPRSLALRENYRNFARVLRGELSLAEHPLNARTALAGHEVLSAIYESARVRDRVTLPLAQADFPLESILRGAG